MRGGCAARGDGAGQKGGLSAQAAQAWTRTRAKEIDRPAICKLHGACDTSIFVFHFSGLLSMRGGCAARGGGTGQKGGPGAHNDTDQDKNAGSLATSLAPWTLSTAWALAPASKICVIG